MDKKGMERKTRKERTQLLRDTILTELADVLPPEAYAAEKPLKNGLAPCE